MSGPANPFTDLRPETHDVIERLLGRIWTAGDWGEEDDDLLDQWRAARGEAGKGEWRWWAGPVDDMAYEHEAASRDEAISIGRREYRAEGQFRIIEARSWSDDVKAGDDLEFFAESRNHAVIVIASND